MKLPGWCIRCRKFVDVTPVRPTLPGGFPPGICDDCEE